jgi:hypothetical protein
MLEHGPDPEQLGAWPAARTIVIAGFVGVAEYVRILRTHGVRWTASRARRSAI